MVNKIKFPTENVKIAETADDVAGKTCKFILKVATKSVTDSEGFNFALSGGSTPLATYELLAESPFKEEFPFEETHFYWSDERCVTPDDPNSNFKMANDALLSKIPVSPDNIHRLCGEYLSPDQAALEYEEELPDTLDLILLGIGADGHVASIYPGSEAEQEESERVLSVYGAGLHHNRVTITPAVIKSAAKVLVIATGASKADAIRNAFTKPRDEFDISAWLAENAFWIIDKDAAGLSE